VATRPSIRVAIIRDFMVFLIFLQVSISSKAWTVPEGRQGAEANKSLRIWTVG
jgi:hypothetical protein